MPPPQGAKLRVGLAPRFGGGAFTFLRQDRERHQFGEPFLVRRAVKALVQADAAQIGEALGQFRHHGDRHLVVGLTLHDAMAEDKAILILVHQHPQAQFHRDAGLAFGNPLGMRLENGEDLFGMRNALALQHPAPDLVDLALGMGEVIIQGREPGRGLMMHFDQGKPGGPCAGQEAFRQRQIVLMRLADLDLPRGALGLILGPRALDLLGTPEGFLHAADIVGMLAPVAEAGHLAQPGAGLDHLAHGVIQQVGVGGIVNIGLDDEGITAHGDPFARVFFTKA